MEKTKVAHFLWPTVYSEFYICLSSVVEVVDLLNGLGVTSVFSLKDILLWL